MSVNIYDDTQGTLTRCDGIAFPATLIEKSIPTDETSVNIDYPAGFTKGNTYVVAGKALTKYDSLVDQTYDSFAYWGYLTFSNADITFKPKVVNNVKKIYLALIRIDN